MNALRTLGIVASVAAVLLGGCGGGDPEGPAMATAETAQGQGPSGRGAALAAEPLGDAPPSTALAAEPLGPQ